MAWSRYFRKHVRVWYKTPYIFTNDQANEYEDAFIACRKHGYIIFDKEKDPNPDGTAKYSITIYVNSIEKIKNTEIRELLIDIDKWISKRRKENN